jgi:hypothetical protein
MGRKFWYSVIAMTAIFSIVITFAGIWQSKKQMNERILLLELTQLRSAIQIYKNKNHKNPENIHQLFQEDNGFTPSPRALTLDDNGNPKDPFGNVYLYDKNSAAIISQTKKYKNW